MKDWTRRIAPLGGLLFRYLMALPTLVLALGLLVSFITSGILPTFRLLYSNPQLTWLIILSLLVLTTLAWLLILARRLPSGFREDFRGDLSANWDFQGPWKKTDANTMIVTGSDQGGITKAGAAWENYTFSFRARIMNKCLGAVVRAQDLNNYTMFQISRDTLFPHRRATVPVVDEPTGLVIGSPPSKDGTLAHKPVRFLTGWQVLKDEAKPIIPPIDDSFDVQITVRGMSVSVRINQKIVFQDDSFLKTPVGKVGFRCSSDEAAEIQRVRVTLHA